MTEPFTGIREMWQLFKGLFRLSLKMNRQCASYLYLLMQVNQNLAVMKWLPDPTNQAAFDRLEVVTCTQHETSVQFLYKERIVVATAILALTFFSQVNDVHAHSQIFAKVIAHVDIDLLVLVNK